MEKIKRLALLPYKNLAIALLFSLFFGPLGLLYSSFWGGIVMIPIAIVVIGGRLPGPIIMFWILCSIWSVAAATRYNNKISDARLRSIDDNSCSSEHTATESKV